MLPRYYDSKWIGLPDRAGWIGNNIHYVASCCILYVVANGVTQQCANVDMIANCDSIIAALLRASCYVEERQPAHTIGEI